MPSKSLDLNKNEYLSLDKSSTSDSVDEGKQFLINFNKMCLLMLNAYLCIGWIQIENLVVLDTFSLYKEPKERWKLIENRGKKLLGLTQLHFSEA